MMKKMKWAWAIIFGCITVIGCENRATKNRVDDGLIDAFESAGLEVAEGAATTFLVEDCEAIQNCFANNPASPYLLFSLPSISGVAADLPAVTVGAIPRVPNDMRASHYLNTNDAVVIVGRTPPAAKYFGLTPYIYTRVNEAGQRVTIFASIRDTLNHLTLTTGQDTVFDQAFAVIFSSDAGAMSAARAALETNGIAPRAINEVSLSRELIRFGEGADRDTLMILARIGLFEDPAIGQAYLEEMPLRVFRLTAAEESMGLSMPERLQRGDGVRESEIYSEALDELQRAIFATLEDGSFDRIPVQDALTVERANNGAKCIEDVTACRADNPDTVYTAGPINVGLNADGVLEASPRQDLFLDENDYFLIYGVNHQASEKAMYMNLGVYKAAGRIGVASITDEDLVGSAEQYVPTHPQKGALFAYEVRRECNARPFCLSLPTTFPGVAYDESIFFIFRAYLNPGLTVGPSPDEVLPERILHVRVGDGE